MVHPCHPMLKAIMSANISMKRKLILFASLVSIVGVQVADAAPKPTPQTAAVRPGQYACVFAFGGQFFDSKPIYLRDGNRYESQQGAGTWSYQAKNRLVKFSGSLARDYVDAQYVSSGSVPGGLKKKQGPALVLKPSAAPRKAKGMEAVPMYCYWTKEKK